MKKVHNCPLARLPCLWKQGRLATIFFAFFFSFLGPRAHTGHKTQTFAWYLFGKWWSADL